MPCEKSVTSVVPGVLSSMRSSRSAERAWPSRFDAVHLRDEGQRFLRGQSIEERQILGDHADPPLDRDRIGQRIGAEDRASMPAVGRSRPVRHLIVVDLPAPFGPEESVEAAGGDGEIDAVHRAEITEVAGQAGGLDREVPMHGTDCIVRPVSARITDSPQDRRGEHPDVVGLPRR